MWKLFAVVLLIVGLILGGLAYSYYSESTIAGSQARYYRNNPGETPPTLTGESREQFIEAELRCVLPFALRSLLFASPLLTRGMIAANIIKVIGLDIKLERWIPP